MTNVCSKEFRPSPELPAKLSRAAKMLDLTTIGQGTPRKKTIVQTSDTMPKTLIITAYSAPNNSSPQIITSQLGQNCSTKNLKIYLSWLFDAGP